jgi:hypothetical protein
VLDALWLSFLLEVGISVVHFQMMHEQVAYRTFELLELYTVLYADAGGTRVTHRPNSNSNAAVE